MIKETEHQPLDLGTSDSNTWLSWMFMFAFVLFRYCRFIISISFGTLTMKLEYSRIENQTEKETTIWSRRWKCSILFKEMKKRCVLIYMYTVSLGPLVAGCTSRLCHPMSLSKIMLAWLVSRHLKPGCDGKHLPTSLYCSVFKATVKGPRCQGFTSKKPKEKVRKKARKTRVTCALSTIDCGDRRNAYRSL